MHVTAALPQLKAMPKFLQTMLLSLLMTVPLMAGSQLVKQIRATSPTHESAPYLVQPYGNGAAFIAWDFDRGSRVWKTDGTTAGTIPIADPSPGPPMDYSIEWFTPIGDTIWLGASDGVHGIELWKSDGTEAGTVMVKDIVPGSRGSGAKWMWPGGNLVFFSADDGVRGRELWRSDGTAAGTWLVKDIVPGAGTSNPGPLHDVGDGLLFLANDGVHGTELWKTDGTEAGTFLVKDINTGSGSLSWSSYGSIGSTFFLGIDDGVHGRELWKSDGTEAGTVLVKDILPGSSGGLGHSETMPTVGGKILFMASDGVSGSRLWKSDGTEAGTVQVWPHYATALTAWGSKAAFFRSVEGRIELWATDGTEAGTAKIAAVDVGYQAPFRIYAAGTRLFFWIGLTLWVSDGTAAGTHSVTTFPASPYLYNSPSVAGTAGDVALITLEDPIAGWELWRSDGTAGGTTLLRDINDRPVGINPDYRFTSAVLGNNVIFGAHDGTHGFELWKSDGTELGTAIVQDSTAGSASSDFRRLSPVGAKVFYGQSSSATGTEPWVTNGSSAGMIADVSAGSGSSVTTETRFSDLGGVAYFSNITGGLSRSNGSTVTPLAVGPLSSSIVTMGGKLYFATNDGTNGVELWTNDGTSSSLLKNIHATGSSSPQFLTPVGAFVYFFADDGVNGRELWRTDGTAAGTVLVADTIAGAAGLTVSETAAVGTTLFFLVSNAANGTELWKSDGTAFGTIVLEVNSGTYVWPYPYLPHLFPLGTNLLYFADDGVHGLELRFSDGTVAGTRLVRDINPGVFPSLTPSSTAVVFGGRLFFGAFDPEHGTELWVSDGTTAGTRLAADVAAGAASSDARVLSPTATQLLFVASNPATGYQLYRYVAANLAQTTITATPPEAPVGESVTLTVTLRDAGGAPMTESGGVVALQTTHGTLSTVIDHADGTYTATLTASTAGTAAVTATLDGAATGGLVEVTFAAFAGTTTVTATATSTTTVLITWTATEGATAYDLYRRDGNGGYAPAGSFGGLSTTVAGVTPSTTYLFRVRPRANANLGILSAPDLATTFLFVDDPLVAGTIVKRQHFTELLIAINSVRAAASLAPITQRNLTGATILAADLQQLRDALSTARSTLGFGTAWSESSLGVIRAVHVHELRAAVK